MKSKKAILGVCTVCSDIRDFIVVLERLMSQLRSIQKLMLKARKKLLRLQNVGILSAISLSDVVVGTAMVMWLAVGWYLLTLIQ